MLTVYGIRQCDTCRKALKWLQARAVEHRFHDLRADGLQGEKLGGWLASPFASSLINRRSTTWRQLSADQRASTGSDLQALVLEFPTLIKRPVFEDGDVIAVGFDEAARQALSGRG
jgi:Spx/MgsR family transcriptional regulator